MKGLEELKLIEKGIEWNKLDTVSYRIFKAKFITIEKELKALELILDSKIDIEYLKLCDNFVQYNDYVRHSYNKDRKTISLNDFDLLKEVLK